MVTRAVILSLPFLRSLAVAALVSLTFSGTFLPAGTLNEPFPSDFAAAAVAVAGAWPLGNNWITMKQAGGHTPVPKFAEAGFLPSSTALTMPGGGSLIACPMVAGASPTVMATVATLESALPSLALKVNESGPS